MYTIELIISRLCAGPRRAAAHALFGLCVLALPLTAPAATSGVDAGMNNLRPTDTSSPRATLASFQETAREMVRRHRARMDPAEVDRAVTKMLDTLDLSGLPPVEQTDQGMESAALLLEILGRIPLPPPAEIPDAAAVEADGLTRWTLPGTEIVIARTKEGPDEGRFQFSWPTVQHLPEYYELVRDLPARPDSPAGFYEEWSYGPGPWIPASWTANLPAFAYLVIWHQSVWQWLATGATIALTVLVAMYAYRFARGVDRVDSAGLQRGHLARLGVVIVTIVALGFAARILDDAVNLTGPRLFLLNGILHIARYSAVGWAIILGLETLGAGIIQLRETHPGSIDAALVRVVVRLLGICSVFALAIWVAYSFGVPVAPLVASLGVGGIAIALAIRPTLESIIGGFILFADKPVRVGDFCRYGDQLGTVEEIGLRSTKIRSMERSTVTVPNAEFSNMKLENFAKRDMRLLNPVLQLRYDTTPDQMRWILARLRELLLGHPVVASDSARVRLSGFGPTSKDVEVFAYLRCQDQETFLAVREDLLLRVEEVVRAGGSGFVVPSTRSSSSGAEESPDLECRGAAEEEVGRWRAEGRLPFPDFDERERDRLTDVLDYPPQGSPHYRPPQSAAEREQAMASASFTAQDLVDLPSFVARLRVGGPLSEFLFGEFSAQTRLLISNYQGGADTELRQAIVDVMNTVASGPCLYEAKRFEQVQLSPETLALLERAPRGRELRLLNWLLLLDAYPAELSRRIITRA